MMYTFISNAVSSLETAARAIMDVLKKGDRKYLSTIDNMFLHDDIFDHEAFR